MRKMRIEENDRLNSLDLPWPFRTLRPAALLLMICLSCSAASAGTSRLYPPAKDEAGALRLTQVMQLASRDEILKLKENLEHLLASGVKDSDLKDGSVATGRIYCCHQWTEEGTAIWFYVPPDVTVAPGDLVVVRMGHEANKKDPGTVNTVVEVREKKDAPDSKCSWDPPDNSMWTRVLYCTWMQAEGWTLKNGLHKTWLKRPSDAKP
jgi:hypothetical protein